MSKEINERFLADPLRFCQQNVVIVNCGTSSLKAKKDGLDFDLQSVTSDQRVLYCDLSFEGTQSYYMARVVPLDQAGQHHFPVFWLPWSQDKAYKCTLKDKRSEKEQEERGPARIFFTATVDGCSILATYPRDTPSVYHLNAVSEGQDKLDALERVQAKMKKMQERMDNMPQTRAQARWQGQVIAGRSIHGRDYMDDWAQGVDLERDNQLAARFADDDEVGAGVAKRAGTVFGFKDEEGWSFYFQKRLRIKLRKVEVQWCGLKRTLGLPNERWALQACQKFWP